MTHACVASAARDAVPLGYNVIVADDATRDLDMADGRSVSHDTLHRAALPQSTTPSATYSQPSRF